MGQYNNEEGGIFLIESVEDIARLPVQESDDLTFMTQTTLSLDDTAETISALKDKYPAIQGPHKNDICYATTNRQEAVRELAKQCDLVVVVGSKNSSNSKPFAIYDGITTNFLLNAFELFIIRVKSSLSFFSSL